MDFNFLSNIRNIGNVESTSFISGISYDIEILLFNGEKLDEIKDEILELQNTGEFPPYLQLVDATFDQETGANGVAFRDTRTNEIIIGHAGTNFGKGWGVVEDLIANAQIGFGGIQSNSAYVAHMTNFVQRVKDRNSQSVTTVTGHSLGGKKAQITGLLFNLNIVTFNAAPLRANPNVSAPLARGLANGVVTFPFDVASLLSPPLLPLRFIADGIADLTVGRAVQGRVSELSSIHENWINSLLKNHSGYIAHFYTTADWLKLGARLTNSPYAGNLVLIDNGGGHGLYEFTNKEDLQFITKEITRRRDFANLQKELSISFRNNEFTIPEGLRTPTRVLGSSAIMINPQTLYRGMTTLQQIHGNRFSAISDLITLSQRQNNQLASNRNRRRRQLIGQSFTIMIEAGYETLTQAMDNSINQLRNALHTMNALRHTQLLSASGFEQRFQNTHFGTNSQTRWLLNGSTWTGRTIHSRFQELITIISYLYNEINNSPLENFHVYSSHRDFPMNATNEETMIYISRFNHLVESMVQSFSGDGARARFSQDAIVQTMRELLTAVEGTRRNIEEKNNEIINNGRAIASNTENFDKVSANAFSNAFSNAFTNGSSVTPMESLNRLTNAVQLNVRNVSSLGNGESISSARQAQIQRSSSHLVEQTLRTIRPLNDALMNHVTKVLELLGELRNSLGRWNEVLSRRISSQTPTDEFHFGGNMQSQTHFPLGNYLPTEISNPIQVIEQNIFNWESGYRGLGQSAYDFNTGLHNISSRIRREVGTAVYPLEEIEPKMRTGKATMQMLDACSREYEMLASDIRSSMSGTTILKFVEEIEQLARFLRTVSERVSSDFGIVE